MLTLQFDGLHREAPPELHLNSGAGFMCFGWLISLEGITLARGHGGYVRGKDASSNVAEYLGLVEGMGGLLDMGAQDEEILIRGDAKSVIEQMQGISIVNARSIKLLNKQARRLSLHFPRITWDWSPRKLNREADALARRALNQLLLYPAPYEEALHKLQILQEAGHYGSNHLLPILDVRMFQGALRSSLPLAMIEGALQLGEFIP